MTEPMTDEELADYLGFSKTEPKRLAVVRGLAPEKRALYDRMREVEGEVTLWLEGVGPKPTGVLIDLDKPARRPAIRTVSRRE